MRLFVELLHEQPLAAGEINFVFLHPDDPDLLIKVVRPDALVNRWGSKGRWYKKLDRAKQNVAFVRELAEYCALLATFPKEVLPVERPVGLLQTDYGLGLVVEAVRAADGTLAPTVAQLVERQGLTTSLRQGLEEFREALLKFDVVVSAISPANLVLDQLNKNRIVLVDGLGEKAAIPVNYWFRTFRRAAINRRFDRMMSALANSGAANATSGQRLKSVPAGNHRGTGA